MCEGHQFSVAEMVHADVGAVRAALLNVQNFDQFTSVAHSLQALSENEFSGMGRPLFLRELVSVRLLQGSSVQGSSQVRETLAIKKSLTSCPFPVNPMMCSPEIAVPHVLCALREAMGQINPLTILTAEVATTPCGDLV